MLDLLYCVPGGNICLLLVGVARLAPRRPGICLLSVIDPSQKLTWGKMLSGKHQISLRFLFFFFFFFFCFFLFVCLLFVF